jgi:SAM-dependent methyltransferase
VSTPKIFSQACENNRQPILDLLLRFFAKTNHVLEVGSGTGQHAAFFAPRLPHLVWQTSDLTANHAIINAWIDDCPSSNIRRPLVFDASSPCYSYSLVDGLFTANTCHIMPWPAVVSLFAGLPLLLAPEATVVIYGPFKYGGKFTSASNADFDYRLKEYSPHQGIRDFEAISGLASAAGLVLQEDQPMPANNRLLVWQRTNT